MTHTDVTPNRRIASKSRWTNTILLLLVLVGLVLTPTLGEDAGDDAAAVDDAYEGVDDNYVNLDDADFDGMALMPVSCVNYMQGHMIKFEIFGTGNNFSCHSNTVGTFVVSIGHYMRAYFNYQSLLQGADFRLPSDAGYLNCVLLQQTAYSEQKLYAKIGCLERETYTSTKLRIHVYTDKQCSVDYDDGQSESQRARRGYSIDGYYFNAKVSFRPSFYSCESCQPQQIADGFSKQGTFWYDDDVAANGGQMYKYFDDWLDDYFLQDDAYFVVQQYTGNEIQSYKADDDDFYTQDDDGGRKLNEPPRDFVAAVGELEKFEKEFWAGHSHANGQGQEHRALANDDAANDDGGGIDDSVLSWNMCSKLYKYGVWCDEDCRSLDTFRIDEWSTSDVFLLVIMCVFMASMMGLIFAKRVKAYEKAAIYADDDENAPDLGLKPIPMGAIFLVALIVIIVMANLRLVNETLVVAVVSCILLFIYMLKLTLFESKNPGLLGNNKKHQIDYSYGGNSLFNLT